MCVCQQIKLFWNRFEPSCLCFWLFFNALMLACSRFAAGSVVVRCRRFALNRIRLAQALCKRCSLGLSIFPSLQQIRARDKVARARRAFYFTCVFYNCPCAFVQFAISAECTNKQIVVLFRNVNSCSRGLAKNRQERVE